MCSSKYSFDHPSKVSITWEVPSTDYGFDNQAYARGLKSVLKSHRQNMDNKDMTDYRYVTPYVFVDITKKKGYPCKLLIDSAIDEWTLRTYNPVIEVSDRVNTSDHAQKTFLWDFARNAWVMNKESNEDSDSDDTEVLSGRGTDDDYGFEDYMGSDSETGEDTDDMDQTDEYDSEDDFIDDDETCEESDGSSDSSEDDSGDDEDEDDDDADSTDDNENDDEDVMLDDETDIDDDSEDQRNVELSDILIEKNISISGHQDSVLQTWVHMLISKRSSMELILSDEQGVKIQAAVSDGEISVASSRIDVAKRSTQTRRKEAQKQMERNS
ncbi:glutamic acid-rich protein-like [Eutrema salsugineum]|uniref:glutamic acid-rich protein-like n=1 Tax=Eutrema salsugineum TaxID=72664 RepID=UPI000CED16FA|nr:glutamic acid-rich protein-like [Eutrema salsugineum]